MKIGWQAKKWLGKKTKGGFRGYPMGTIAFYGPDDRRASKIAAGVVAGRGAEPEMRRWFAEDRDLRHADDVIEEVALFLREHGVRSVAMVDSIFGCPHEEGVDYPLGEKCPKCPFWADKDRSAALRR
jgi:hypothetical protein